MVKHSDCAGAFGRVYVEHAPDEIFEMVAHALPLLPVKVELILYYIFICCLYVIFV